MTLMAGIARHDHVPLHLDPLPPELWTLPVDDGFASVVLGTMSALAPLSLDWWRRPIPVVQLGRRNERHACHARVVVGRYHPDRIGEAEEISRSLYPAVAQRAGFVATLVATERAEGRTFSVSLWERSADSDADVADGWFREQVARFDELYVEPPKAVRADLVAPEQEGLA